MLLLAYPVVFHNRGIPVLTCSILKTLQLQHLELSVDESLRLEHQIRDEDKVGVMRYLGLRLRLVVGILGVLADMRVFANELFCYDLIVLVLNAFLLLFLWFLIL